MQAKCFLLHCRGIFDDSILDLVVVSIFQPPSDTMADAHPQVGGEGEEENRASFRHKKRRRRARRPGCSFPFPQRAFLFCCVREEGVFLFLPLCKNTVGAGRKKRGRGGSEGNWLVWYGGKDKWEGGQKRGGRQTERGGRGGEGKPSSEKPYPIGERERENKGWRGGDSNKPETTKSELDCGVASTLSRSLAVEVVQSYTARPVRGNRYLLWQQNRASSFLFPAAGPLTAPRPPRPGPRRPAAAAAARGRRSPSPTASTAGAEGEGEEGRSARSASRPSTPRQQV